MSTAAQPATTLSAPDETVNVTAPTAAPVPTLGSDTSGTMVPPEQNPATPPGVTAAAAAAAIDAHHHSGLMRVLDAIGTGLGGSKTLEVTTTPDGGLHVTPRESSTGEKFSRAAINALRGMAAGMSVPSGPGVMMRAAGASIGAGMGGAANDLQQAKGDAQQNLDNQQKTSLHNANMALLNQRTAEGAFSLARDKTQFIDGQFDRQNALADRISANPSNRDLGVLHSSADLPELLKSQPDAIKNHVNGQIYMEPEVDSSGVTIGVHAYYLDKDWKDRKNDKPVVQHYLAPNPDKPLGSPPEYQTRIIPAGAMSNGDIMLSDAALAKDGVEASDKERKAKREDFSAQSEAGLRTAEGSRARAGAARDYADAGKTRVEADLLKRGSGGATGDAALANFSPGYAQIVKATAHGDIAMPPAGTRNKQSQQLRNDVLAVDPTYKDSRYTTKQHFKTGGDSASMVSLATVMEHLERLHDNSNKIGFSPLLTQGLSPESTAYNDDLKLFTQEAGKLVKNGVLGVEEYRDLKQGLESRSQKNRNASIEELTSLMGGKVRGLAQKYKTGTGSDMDPTEFFDAPTQARLARYGILGGGSGASAAPPAQPSANPAAAGGATVTDPRGVVHTFPNQQAADAFKQAAGLR